MSTASRSRVCPSSDPRWVSSRPHASHRPDSTTGSRTPSARTRARAALNSCARGYWCTSLGSQYPSEGMARAATARGYARPHSLHRPKSSFHWSNERPRSRSISMHTSTSYSELDGKCSASSRRVMSRSLQTMCRWQWKASSPTGDGSVYIRVWSRESVSGGGTAIGPHSGRNHSSAPVHADSWPARRGCDWHMLCSSRRYLLMMRSLSMWPHTVETTPALSSGTPSSPGGLHSEVRASAPGTRARSAACRCSRSWRRWPLVRIRSVSRSAGVPSAKDT